MKDILKCIALLFVGLFVAGVLYPFLHETGHSVVAILIGAKIVKFNLLPLPYVVCEVTKVGNFGRICIALGGVTIPLIISMLFKPKNFWFWYINLIIKGISIYAVLLSIIAMFLYINGVIWMGDDIIQVLKISSKEGYWLFAYLLIAAFGVGIIIKEKPILKCCEYFEVTREK